MCEQMFADEVRFRTAAWPHSTPLGRSLPPNGWDEHASSQEQPATFQQLAPAGRERLTLGVSRAGIDPFCCVVKSRVVKSRVLKSRVLKSVSEDRGPESR